MLALITGASSGIGRDIARVLGKRGYNLIITARDKEKLLELKEDIEAKNKVKVVVLTADLGNEKEVYELYSNVKKVLNEKETYEISENEIDVFINNAGLGIAGEFWKTNLETEVNMLKVNDLAMHILFKLILMDMLGSEKKEPKYILNVSSLAGFMPGPRMSAYYATKAYMLNLTRGVYQELKMIKSNISISVLCPGPVCTNFADRACVNFKIKSLSSEYTAQYAIDKMFAKRLVIVPGFLNKCGHVLGKILPAKLSMAVTYRIQEAYRNKYNYH